MPVERYWEPTPFWKGETAFVLGGGPSLREVDLSPLVGRCVIALNNSWYARPGVEFWRDDAPIEPGPWQIAYFNDGPWWDQYGDEFRRFPGLQCTIFANRQLPGVAHLRRGRQSIVDERPGWIGYGNDAGIMGPLLAHKLGCRRAVLLGYDFRRAPDGHNWHSRHTRPIPAHAYQQMYLGPYREIAPQLAGRGFDVVNCTPGSALDVFRFGDLKDFV